MGPRPAGREIQRTRSQQRIAALGIGAVAMVAIGGVLVSSLTGGADGSGTSEYLIGIHSDKGQPRIALDAVERAISLVEEETDGDLPFELSAKVLEGRSVKVLDDDGEWHSAWLRQEPSLVAVITDATGRSGTGSRSSDVLRIAPCWGGNMEQPEDASFAVPKATAWDIVRVTGEQLNAPDTPHIDNALVVGNSAMVEQMDEVLAEQGIQATLYRENLSSGQEYVDEARQLATRADAVLVAGKGNRALLHEELDDYDGLRISLDPVEPACYNDIGTPEGALNGWIYPRTHYDADRDPGLTAGGSALADELGHHRSTPYAAEIVDGVRLLVAGLDDYEGDFADLDEVRERLLLLTQHITFEGTRGEMFVGYRRDLPRNPYVVLEERTGEKWVRFTETRY